MPRKGNVTPETEAAKEALESLRDLKETFLKQSAAGAKPDSAALAVVEALDRIAGNVKSLDKEVRGLHKAAVFPSTH